MPITRTFTVAELEKLGVTYTNPQLDEIIEMDDNRELHNLVDYPFAHEYAKLTAFLSTAGIPSLDLTAAFKDDPKPQDLWVALDDAHPNAVAHRKIANLAFEFIVGLK